jgi:peptide/nickel transport system permease protein
MAGYLVKRVLYSVLLLFLIVFVSFVVITLPPGDFMTTLQSRLTQQGGLSHAEAMRVADRLRERYGLDKPFFVQFGKWLFGIISKGDFGYSFRHRKPVSEVIWSRLGWTVLLAVCVMLISVVGGIIAGIYSATHQYSFGDSVLSVISYVSLSIPNFFLALVMIYVLIFHVGVRSIGGFFSLEMVLRPWSWAKFVDFMSHFWVPVFVIGVAGTAIYLRLMRANLLDVLGCQYIQVARAKGLKERAVVYRHALRNALHPIVMTIGMSLPWIIQGAVVVGIVLDLPTVGTTFLTAILEQDMYLAGSFLLFLAIITVIGNILADIALAWVDPRIRYE